MTDRRIRFGSHEQVRSLFGTNDRNLKRLRERLHIDVVLRGDEVRITGAETEVEAGSVLFEELRSIIERKGHLPDDDFERLLGGSAAQKAAASSSGESGENGQSIEIFHKAKRVYPLGPGQRDYIAAIRNHDLVFAAGPAGSGKTYLAVAMAVNALRQELVRKIVLVRPAVEAGEKLGFLPGDMFAKVNPYLRPLLDALGDILDYDTVQRYLDKDVIEIVPLAFMRGRTLNNTFIILDEAQNTTTVQMKMFLTRMGHHSKIVVTGDHTQIDLPDHVACGLTDALYRLRGVPGISVIELSGSDIVRHPLVRRIVEAYDDGHEPSGRRHFEYHAPANARTVEPPPAVTSASADAPTEVEPVTPPVIAAEIDSPA